jgi:hypothetical protein
VASNGAGAPPRTTTVTALHLRSLSRTAVRAEIAGKRQALHSAIGRGATPELGVVVVAWGGHGEAR